MGQQLDARSTFNHGSLSGIRRRMDESTPEPVVKWTSSLFNYALLLIEWMQKQVGKNLMNTTQAAQLGEVLRTRRIQLGMSTFKVAKAAGINQSSVVRFEQGQFAVPHPNKLVRLADALGLNAADLFAMAEYTVPSDLPSLGPYLRTKYPDVPLGTLDRIENYVTAQLDEFRHEEPRPLLFSDPDPTTQEVMA